MLKHVHKDFMDGINDNEIQEILLCDVKDTSTQDTVLDIAHQNESQRFHCTVLSNESQNLSLCDVVVVMVILDMDMAEADEVNPNPEIEMVTLHIVADSKSVSSVQHLGRKCNKWHKVNHFQNMCRSSKDNHSQSWSRE